MAISGITTTADNGVERITTTQTVTGTATVDGETIVLDNTSAVLECTGTGSVVVANSQIKLDDDLDNNQNDASAPINYGGRTVTTTEMAFRNTSILCGPFTARANIQVTELTDTEIIEADDTGQMFCYTGTDAIVNNVRFKGINCWEIYQPPSVFFNTIVEDCNYGFLAWECGRVDVFGFQVTNAGVAEIWIGSGNSGNNYAWMWNNHSTFDDTNVRHESANNVYYKGYTASWKFVDQITGAAVEDVVVIYSEEDDGAAEADVGRYITNSSGYLVGTFDTQFRASGASQQRPTLFILTKYSDTSGSTYQGGGLDSTYDLLNVVPSVEVRAYSHLSPSGFEAADTLTITSEIGSINSDLSVNRYQDFTLTPDTGITVAKAVADAYTTFTTLSQMYDRIKSEWVDTDDYPLPVKDGLDMYPGSTNVIINGTAGSAYAYTSGTDTLTLKATAIATTTKFTAIIAASLTLQNGAAIDGINVTGTVTLSEVIDMENVTITGNLVIAVAGTYNFTNVTVTGDVTNSTGGAVTVNLFSGSNMTTSESGTGNGQVNLVNTVPIKVTVKDAATLELIQGARVLLQNGVGGPGVEGTTLINALTDSSGEVNSTMDYSGDQPVVGRVRKGT